MEKLVNLNAIEIQKYQNNRYPYFFIDKITEVVPGKYAKGFKNLTYNEWYFPTHYKENAIMPGALQVEAMAQIFMMTFLTLPDYKAKFVAGIGYNNVRFHRMLVPGDKIDFEAKLLSFRGGVAKGIVKGHVDGCIACESELILGIPDIIFKFMPKK